MLLALFVEVGVLPAGPVQAGQQSDAIHSAHQARDTARGENRWQSIWGLDLAGKLKQWRPKVTYQTDAEGFNLARPFGKSGPTIQCSSSLPDSVQNSLRAGGDSRISALGTDTDVFVFLQKLW